MSTSLRLSPEVFAIWCALIEERAGIHYRLQDRDLVEDKLSARALDAGFSSLLDYYYFLRYDDPTGEALEALIDGLVVNETYFFRELSALEAVVQHVLAPQVDGGRRPRVWCAACSTGEEPLTLAMLLAEKGLGGKVDILATDISHRALAKAKSLVRPTRSLRSRPPAGLAERWLSEREGVLHVSPALVGAVDFRRVNLLDDATIESLGLFDAVLCRNALIYFDTKTVQRVVARLARSLRPGGALVVGATESLLRFDVPLRCEARGGAFLYRNGASE